MLEVLVADDDRNVRESVASALASAGHRVTEACDGAEAVELMASRVFDLAICDVQMPRLGGLALLRRIRREAPGTAVVIMTAFGEIPDVVGSIHDGAVDFVTKPFDPDEFTRRVVGPIAEQRGLRSAFDRARAAQIARTTGTTMVTTSPVMRALAEQIRVLASSDVPVLVSGDRGTGKELVARTLHAQGARSAGPFVLVDGTLLREMLADRGDGLAADDCFRDARGGTLVLDGIETLSLRAQLRLLRAMDANGAGARRGPPWHMLGVRLVTLTRENPAGRTASSQLVDALHYRLSAAHLHVPALRERAADFCDLVVQLIDELEPAGTTRPGMTPQAWRLLGAYPFPGNVRELRWALEHALATAEGGPIDAEHLPPEVAVGIGNGVTAR
jgi:two-component system response regulator PilR (NtrC family)